MGAKKVLEAVKDGRKVTRVERWTLRYCLVAYNWTEAGMKFIREEVKKLPHEDLDQPKPKDDEPKEPDAKKQKPDYYDEVDGKKLDRKLLDTVKEAVSGEKDGRVSVEDSKKIIAAAL